MNLITVCCYFVVVTLFVHEIHGYTVVGNKIHDPNGDVVLLRGVDKCSFEWSAVGEHASLSDYQLMRAWGSNVVRLSMNQDFWLSGAANYVAGYKATIDQQVQWIKSTGMGVILDLHWSDQGNLQNTSPNQQCMADANSITFWTEVATVYKSDPWVMFELYNEPHDVSWSIWLSGGTACGYTVVGMQQLYNAIRGTGAQNVVIAGGLNYAFDLTGIANNALTGVHIAYATHPYDYGGKDKSTWAASFGYLLPNYPVIATEFGQYCNTDTYVQDLMDYFTANGVHWTAWAWYVNGCSFPSIISDWNGTPTSIGVIVQKALGGNVTGLTTAGSGSTSGTAGSSSSGSTGSTPPAGSNIVYTDSLQGNWNSYGWAGDLS